MLQLADGLGDFGLGRVEEVEESYEGHPDFVVLGYELVSFDVLVSDAQDAKTLSAQVLEAFLDLPSSLCDSYNRPFRSLDRSADIEHFLQGPFRYHQFLTVLRHKDAEPLAYEVVGNFVELCVTGQIERFGTNRFINRIRESRLVGGIEIGVEKRLRALLAVKPDD